MPFGPIRKTFKKQNKNKKKPTIELFFYVFIVSSMFFLLARSAPSHKLNQ